MANFQMPLVTMTGVILIAAFSFHRSTSQSITSAECDAVDSGAASAAYNRGNKLDSFTNCFRKSNFQKAPGLAPLPGFRTNGLANFCIVIDDKDVDESQQSDQYGGPQDNNHYTILNQLAKKGAWSNQPTDNLPSSLGEYENKLAHMAYPQQGAHNPYYVEVTGISVKGDLLQNWLHFRVFLNRSEALGFDEPVGDGNQVPLADRDKFLHGEGGELNQEHPDNARGTISALLMMVKDQDGWPIGDFSQDIPCHKTCAKYPQETYYGDQTNALPCAFTPPRSNSHPGMFVFDAHPGFYDDDKMTTDRPGKRTTTEPGIDAGNIVTATGNIVTTPPAPPTTKRSRNTIPPLKFPIPGESRRKGVQEVHATWSFNQDACNFASKLYIQTLVLEEVRYPIQPTDSKRPLPAGNKKPKLFGWTAQYNALIPTKSSLGAADYVDLKYLKQRDLRGSDVDCHVPMFDAPKTFFNGFHKDSVPRHPSKGDPGLAVSSLQQYMFALYGVMGFKSYYGQHTTTSKCNGKGVRIPDDFPDKRKAGTSPALPTVHQFLADTENFGIRCPCPSLPSTLPPENATLEPGRLHGRLIHASHMAIAYMLLTPMACFVARYYKETFVTVFCFQEYWWFMWHVGILMVACVFNFGAVLSITRRKGSALPRSDNLIVHIVLGAMSIFVFYMEIFTGFFRVADPKKRLRQIFMHWLIGMVNNACAVGSMFAMAWVNDSGMSCKTVYTIIVWLLFVIMCYVIMELDMRRTDKQLDLKPKRSYLPPPVVRLFNRDAPGRDFRMMMLGIFILGLILLQLLVSYYIWHSAGDSCGQEWQAYYQTSDLIFGEENVGDDDGTGDDDDGDDN